MTNNISNRKDLALSGIFMFAMFIALIVAVGMVSPVLYDVFTAVAFVLMGFSAFYWCRFALKRMGE